MDGMAFSGIRATAAEPAARAFIIAYRSASLVISCCASCCVPLRYTRACIQAAAAAGAGGGRMLARVMRGAETTSLRRVSSRAAGWLAGWLLLPPR